MQNSNFLQFAQTISQKKKKIMMCKLHKSLRCSLQLSTQIKLAAIHPEMDKNHIWRKLEEVKTIKELNYNRKDVGRK